MSHHHSGIDYNDAFELTFYEKDLIFDFIKKELERQQKIQAMMAGVKLK